jgi:phage shock protein A
MADSLSNKARVLGLGFLHNLLDRAIDMNSIPTLQQYERDLESAVYQLMEAQALNNARISQLQNNIAQLDAQEAILDNQIDRLLQLNREDLAGQVQARLDALNRQEEPLVQELQTLEGLKGQYNLVLQKLKAKQEAMRSQIAHLQSLEQSADAQLHAADAIKQVNEILGASGSSDNLAARIDAKSRFAHERLQQEMGTLQQDDEVSAVLEQDDIKGRLEERKQRLGLLGPTTVRELPNT